MPNQNTGYMQELDRWTDQQILRPLHEGWYEYSTAEGEAQIEQAKGRMTELEQVIRKTIRQKVLESYRNGQQAPAEAKPRARAKTKA